MRYLKLFNEAPMYPVIKFDMNGNYIEDYECVSDAARANGINRTDIPNMINGRRKQAGGFLWNYASNYQYNQLKDIRSKKTTYFNSVPHIRSDEEIEASNDLWRKAVSEYEKN